MTPDKQPADCNMTWADINEQNRISTESFVGNDHSSQLLLLCITTSLGSHLMKRLLQNASKGWDDAQQEAAFRGEPRKYRALEAYNGRLTTDLLSITSNTCFRHCIQYVLLKWKWKYKLKLKWAL